MPSFNNRMPGDSGTLRTRRLIGSSAAEVDVAIPAGLSRSEKYFRRSTVNPQDSHQRHYVLVLEVHQMARHVDAVPVLAEQRELQLAAAFGTWITNRPPGASSLQASSTYPTGS